MKLNLNDKIEILSREPYHPKGKTLDALLENKVEFVLNFENKIRYLIIQTSSGYHNG